MRVVSEETKRKMSEAQKARWADPEKRQAYLDSLRQTHVGATRSDKTRAKMSATHRARWEQDPQALASAQATAKKVWEQPGYRMKMALRRAGGLIMDDQGKTYADVAEVVQVLGGSRKAVYRALKHPFTADGQRRLCGGRALTRVQAKTK